MNYVISLLILTIALLMRILIVKNKYYESINYYMILVWITVLIAEIIYSFFITKEDIAFESVIVIIIFSLSSVLVLPIQKIKFKNKYLNTSIIVNKAGYIFIAALFIISNIVLISNFISIGFTVGFKLNLINAHQRELVTGAFGYFYMLGLPLILLLPYTNLKKKKSITLYILLMYGLHTKRLYLFMSLIILFIQYSKDYIKKMKPKYLILFGLVTTLLFHITQFFQNKSIYNILIIDGEGIFIRIKSILLDPLVYIAGNFSNTSVYLDTQDKSGFFLGNTFYWFHSFLANFTNTDSPVLKNPFINIGFISTNTINFISYYIVDSGYLYAFLITLIIMILNEFVSLRNVKLSIVIYPFILANAILSFRQNDYILIYFYFIWFILFFVSVFLTKKDRTLG